MTICAECGVEFVPTRSWSRYCSRRCLGRASARRQREKVKSDAEYAAKHREWQRRSRLNQREKPPPTPKPEASCARCGAAFAVVRKHQRFCSQPCQYQDAMDRIRDRLANEPGYREQARAWKRLSDARRRERRLVRGREYKRAIRRQTMDAYGGRCACCGEAAIEFLTIDHIDGGGNAHRRRLGRSGHTFYTWLRDQGYPTGYQVLCFNCNAAKSIYGTCPHQA